MADRDLEYLDNIIDYCDKVENILNGTCFITTKLDGCNSAIWADADGDMPS